MGIVAIMSGGIFGGLTALVSLIGFGAEWSDALLTYLLSGSIFAAGMLFTMTGVTQACPSEKHVENWSRY